MGRAQPSTCVRSHHDQVLVQKQPQPVLHTCTHRCDDRVATSYPVNMVFHCYCRQVPLWRAV